METREIIVIGGGIAGLSAAIYLGRAQRDTLVVDSDHSMAKWEPSVENYLGFQKELLGKTSSSTGANKPIDHCLRTSVPRLYAAGCVTPANCRMIVAAGQGAVAAQAINRDLFDESLRTHSLRRFREDQLEHEKTVPEEV